MKKIKGGYYIKARCIRDSDIAHAPPHVREVWDYLLREANHRDQTYKGFIVKRGQLFRTYSEIREALSWQIGWRKMTYNENHMKKSMKILREYRMIDTQKELGGVLITVLNYHKYQTPENYEGTSERTSERTIAEPGKNHRIPYNNKNEKNGRNIIYSTKNKKKEKYKDYDVFEMDDKTRAIMRFGVWCSDRDPFPKINRDYYTECPPNNV